MQPHAAGEGGQATRPPPCRLPAWPLAVLLLAWAPAFPVPDPGLAYMPQETALLEVLDRTSGQPLAGRQAALDALAGIPGFEQPDARALLLFEQCDLALRYHADAAPYARGLETLSAARPGQPFVLLAQRACEQQRSERGDIEGRLRLYRESKGIAFPTVRYRLASSYAQAALSMGFIDEALEAVQVALRIAQANDDRPTTATA
jgi:hypothetical protein